MQISRQHVENLLRLAGLPDLAEDAHHMLPDPVEYDRAEAYLLRYGITKDDLISREGGSP